MDELYTVLALSGWRPLKNMYNDIPAFALVNADVAQVMYRHSIKFSIVVHAIMDVHLHRFRDTSWKEVPPAFLVQCAEMLDGSS